MIGAYSSGLEITAGQRTMSGQNRALSEQICYLSVKSVISVFLLVIMGSLTVKNVDKRDGYILSDVSELFVAKSLSMETTQLSTSFRSKRPVMTKEGNHLQSLQILRLTRDVLFVNLVLLCGDVLQNPGPVRIQCFNCHKTIRKNQGRADCSDCLQS